MTKKLTRTIAGVMSLMFVGQIMVFGDGASQGILHADTIASAHLLRYREKDISGKYGVSEKRETNAYRF